MLDEWAARNGLQILERDYRALCQGPFVWRCSRGQAVYRVKVRDAEGQVRTGWVRCGGWELGLLSDQVEVSWD